MQDDSICRVLRTCKYSQFPLQGAENHIKKKINYTCSSSFITCWHTALSSFTPRTTNPTSSDQESSSWRGKIKPVWTFSQGYLSAAQLTHSSPRKSSWEKPKKPELHLWNKESMDNSQMSPLDKANSCCSIISMQLHPRHPQIWRWGPTAWLCLYHQP